MLFRNLLRIERPPPVSITKCWPDRAALKLETDIDKALSAACPWTGHRTPARPFYWDDTVQSYAESSNGLERLLQINNGGVLALLQATFQNESPTSK